MNWKCTVQHVGQIYQWWRIQVCQLQEAGNPELLSEPQKCTQTQQGYGLSYSVLSQIFICAPVYGTDCGTQLTSAEFLLIRSSFFWLFVATTEHKQTLPIDKHISSFQMLKRTDMPSMTSSAQVGHFSRPPPWL